MSERDTFEQIIERIKYVKRVKTDARVAELIGMKRTALVNRKTRDSIPYEELVIFCNKERISIDWLLTGEGAPRDPSREPPLPFQDKLDMVGQNNELAARLIYDEVGVELGYPAFLTALIESLEVFPPGWREYLDGDLTSYEFYEVVKDYISEEIARHKKK